MTKDPFDSERFSIEMIEDITSIPEDQWNACAGKHPFTSYGFLSALETSGSVGPVETGWIPRHIVIKDTGNNTDKNTGKNTGQNSGNQDRLIAALPCYLKTHSQGEYVFDHAWAEAYMRAGGRYYPKLQASIPFTPCTGPRLLVRGDQGIHENKALKTLLIDAAMECCKKMQLSSFHMTFTREEDRHIAATAGLLVRGDQQFHWHNDGFDSFDAFLDSLSSRKRKQIRKERRTAQSSGLLIEQLNGHQMSEHHWDAFFECYLDTGAKKWGRPYLTRAFFTEVAKQIPDQIMVVFVSTAAGEPVAAALNFIGETTLYGRHWGALAHYDCLHFEACYYQAIDYAIKHGLKRVEAGAQGPHKLARGYKPTKTLSVHYLPDPGFHKAVADFLEVEHDHIDADLQYLNQHLPYKKT